MSHIEEVNATISDVKICLDRDVFLSVWVFLDYGDCGGQGFGGYVLGGLPDVAAGNHATQKNLAGEFLVRCMMAADVLDWKHMVGKTVRVRKEHSKVHAIGHITKKGLWFNPGETFKAWEARNA